MRARLAIFRNIVLMFLGVGERQAPVGDYRLQATGVSRCLAIARACSCRPVQLAAATKHVSTTSISGSGPTALSDPSDVAVRSVLHVTATSPTLH